MNFFNVNLIIHYIFKYFTFIFFIFFKLIIQLKQIYLIDNDSIQLLNNCAISSIFQLPLHACSWFIHNTHFIYLTHFKYYIFDTFQLWYICLISNIIYLTHFNCDIFGAFQMLYIWPISNILYLTYFKYYRVVVFHL